MAPKKNLAICIPSGRFVDFGFFKSFTSTIADVLYSWNSAIFTVSSPYIQENRNELARKALMFEEKSGMKFDYVLWLDTDMVYAFPQIQKLISHLENGHDFVSGLYFNPHENAIKPVAYVFADGKYNWLEEKDLKEVMEVDAVGFGFCAMKANVLREVFVKHKPRPFDLQYRQDGGMEGEDQVFCRRAKELGHKIILDTKLIIKHAKGYLPR